MRDRIVFVIDNKPSAVCSSSILVNNLKRNSTCNIGYKLSAFGQELYVIIFLCLPGGSPIGFFQAVYNSEPFFKKEIRAIIFHPVCICPEYIVARFYRSGNCK